MSMSLRASTNFKAPLGQVFMHASSSHKTHAARSGSIYGVPDSSVSLLLIFRIARAGQTSAQLPQR
jgi:hypothetical protein